MKGVLLVVAVFLFSSLNRTYGQVKVSDYLDHFKDESVVFDEYITTYEYFFDPVTKELRVKAKDEVVLIPIKSVYSYTWPIFYNDQISVSDLSAKSSQGKKLKYVKQCGHHEQSGIFYSDARICTYNLPLSGLGEKVFIISEQTFLDPRYFTKILLKDFLSGRKRIVRILWPEWVDVSLIEYNFGEKVIEKEEISSDGKVGVQYTLHWPDKIPNEDDQPHISHFIPHVIPITKSYKLPDSNETKVVLKETNDLYNWYKELISNVNNDSDSLRNLVNSLTVGLEKEEKIKAIYYWVQDNIQYIAFENGIMGFQPANAQEVYYNRYGDCKGMANLLKEMLLLAGFDARLTWLGTNSLPYTYDIPSLTVDNHMICTIVDGEDLRILDATVKFNELGYSPYHIQGKEILIENELGYRIHKIPVASHNNNYETFELVSRISNNVLVGEGELHFQGDSKQAVLNILNNIDKTDHNKFIRFITAQGADPDDFETELVTNHRDSVVRISVKNELRNKVNIFGDELFVEVDFRKEFSNSKIQKNRKSPYDFDRRRFIKSNVTLEIPDGYEVKYLPAAMNISFPEFRFELKYKKEENKVVYSKELIIDSVILKTESFEDWNEAITELTKFYNDPIILKKNAN